MFLPWLQRRLRRETRRPRKRPALFIEPLDERCVPSATPLMEPITGEDEMGPQALTCCELTPLPVSPLPEGTPAAAPAPETAALNDRLFQPGQAGPPSEDVLFLAFPAVVMDVVVYPEVPGITAPPEPTTRPDDTAACRDAGVVTSSAAARVGPSAATPCTVRPQVESLQVKGGQPAEAREEETAASAGEVIEEMMLAIAVDELVGDIVVAFAEEAGGEEAACPVRLLGAPQDPGRSGKSWRS